MIGIYKITSPSGRVYVGQSKRIERRFRDYKLLHQCKKQVLLYRSFIKYGVENHLFEVLEECAINILNERERHWQEIFNSNNGGLNCVLTNTSEKKKEYSIDSKKKMSLNRTGEKNHMFGRRGEKHPLFGTKQSEETKAKYAYRKGLKKSAEHRRKIGEANARRIVTNETRNKISESAKMRTGAKNPFFGKKHSEEAKKKISEARRSNKSKCLTPLPLQ